MQTIIIVNNAAATHDLTVLDNVKGELNITDGNSDAKLARWISVASQQVETYCRRVFAEETVTETFYRAQSTLGLPLGVSIAPPLVNMPLRFDKASKFRLSRYPVSTIISVTEDGTVLDGTTDYQLDPETALLYRLDDDGNPVDWNGSQTAVNYTGGYELLDGLPFDIEQGCIELVKLRWFTAARDPTLRQISVPGVQEETYWVGQRGDDLMPPEIAALLDPYREIHA